MSFGTTSLDRLEDEEKRVICGVLHATRSAPPDAGTFVADAANAQLVVVTSAALLSWGVMRRYTKSGGGCDAASSASARNAAFFGDNAQAGSVAAASPTTANA